MTLPNDVSRCLGINCPHRNDCLRYTELDIQNSTISYTATLNPDKLHECIYFIDNKEN